MKAVLAVDIGNTHTNLGLFRGKRIASRRRTSTKECNTAAKAAAAAARLGFAPREVSGVVIASVVPGRTAVWVALARRLGTEPVLVSGTARRGISIKYDRPASLGADRICNAVAVHARYGGPSVVVDLGTATTCDVVSSRGGFLGGVIAPGLGAMAEALHASTAQLPRVPLRFPRGVIGTSTVESMQSGIMFGSVGAIEGFVERIRKLLGSDVKVIATGGLARLVSRHTRVFDAVDPDLVLRGAKLIYDRVRASR